MLFQGIRFGDFPNHPAGDTGGQGACRDIPGDHAARADDAALSDGYAAADGDVPGDPAVPADGDGLGVFLVRNGAVGLPVGLPVLPAQGMGVSREALGPKNTFSPMVTGQQSMQVKLKLA